MKTIKALPLLMVGLFFSSQACAQLYFRTDVSGDKETYRMFTSKDECRDSASEAGYTQGMCRAGS